MNVARQSHALRMRLEAKYNRKLMRKHPPTASGLFYTIDGTHEGDTVLYRRHRNIPVK